MTNGVTPLEQTLSQTMTFWRNFCFSLMPPLSSASSRLEAQICWFWKLYIPSRSNIFSSADCVLFSKVMTKPINEFFSFVFVFFRKFWSNSHLVGTEFQIVFQYSMSTWFGYAVVLRQTPNWYHLLIEFVLDFLNRFTGSSKTWTTRWCWQLDRTGFTDHLASSFYRSDRFKWRKILVRLSPSSYSRKTTCWRSLLFILYWGQDMFEWSTKYIFL